MMTVSELIEALHGLDPLATVFVVAGEGGVVSKCGEDRVEQTGRGLKPSVHSSMRADRHGVVLYTDAGLAEARTALERSAGGA